MTITFNPDGSASALYTDAFPLRALGTLTVRRASWIDFNEHTQQWEVRLSPHADDPVFTHPSREECIRWEHLHLDT